MARSKIQEGALVALCSLPRSFLAVPHYRVSPGANSYTLVRDINILSLSHAQTSFLTNHSTRRPATSLTRLHPNVLLNHLLLWVKNTSKSPQVPYSVMVCMGKGYFATFSAGCESSQLRSSSWLLDKCTHSEYVLSVSPHAPRLVLANRRRNQCANADSMQSGLCQTLIEPTATVMRVVSYSSTS